jgi:DNA invertase Pin-like site-specific DNA recombinase
LGLLAVDHHALPAQQDVQTAISEPATLVGQLAQLLTQIGIIVPGGTVTHDPTDPTGKMFFNILATFAEFESDLIRLRTREGMAVARAKGKLKGKKPKLSPMQSKELRRMYDTGDYSISDLGDLFQVSRPTIYRTLARQPTTA